MLSASKSRHFFQTWIRTRRCPGVHLLNSRISDEWSPPYYLESVTGSPGHCEILERHRVHTLEISNLCELEGKRTIESMAMIRHQFDIGIVVSALFALWEVLPVHGDKEMHDKTRNCDMDQNIL